MNAPARPKPLPWNELKHRLDENQPFNTMRGTPYYRDAVYEQFSTEEYARRYAAIRAKMRAAKLDCIIVPGGPSHWSFGGGMLWLTGHWEWHALACYVVVPLEGEPTLIYSMSGTHAEAVRRITSTALSDVRGSRGGQYAAVMVDRIRELRLERGRIGLLEILGHVADIVFAVGRLLHEQGVDRGFRLGGPAQRHRGREAEDETPFDFHCFSPC